MAHSRPGFLPLQSHTVPWRASPRPDRGRTGDPRSVGLLFDGGAAQEEAGIAGQRALLFLPQRFIFLRFRCCRFRLWEAKGNFSSTANGFWRPPGAWGAGNSPRMAKMIMKKSSSRRMSMKGGRDWKICRRLLGRKTGRRGVRRGRGGAQGARSGPPQRFCQDGGLALLTHTER